MRAWTRKHSLGGVKLRSEVDPQEARLLRAVVSSVCGLLERRADDAPRDELTELTGLRSGPSTAPDDPALARLLPDFYRPKPDEADEVDLNGALRSLHEPQIIDAKLAAGAVVLQTVPEGGGRITLTPEQADAWLSSLNDVRLSIGVELGLRSGPAGEPGEPDGPYDDPGQQLAPDDPHYAQYSLYQWLTWMQDSLIQALME